MATSRSSKSSGSKTGTKTKSSTARSSGGSTKRTTSKASSSTRAGGGSSSKAAKAKTGGPKKTNSGGTTKTASKQAQPTKAKQAKSAAARTGTGGSRSKASSAQNGRSSAARRTSSTKKGDGLLARMVKSVSNALGGGPPDALELLKKDHRKVDELFSRAKANEDGNNAPTFKKIKAELDVHAHIEEKIFYPFILDRGDQELNRIVREGVQEHKQIKMFLSDLDGMPGTSENFRAKLKVLMEDVEHHVKEEEDEMFPMVRDQIDDADLRKLGQELEKEKAKFMRSPVAKGKKATTKPRAAAAG